MYDIPQPNGSQALKRWLETISSTVDMTISEAFLHGYLARLDEEVHHLAMLEALEDVE